MSDRKARAMSVSFVVAAKFFNRLAVPVTNGEGVRGYYKTSLTVDEVRNSEGSPFADYADASIIAKSKEISKAMVAAGLPPLPEVVEGDKIPGVRKGSITDKASTLRSLADELFEI